MRIGSGQTIQVHFGNRNKHFLWLFLGYRTHYHEVRFWHHMPVKEYRCNKTSWYPGAGLAHLGPIEFLWGIYGE